MITRQQILHAINVMLASDASWKVKLHSETVRDYVNQARLTFKQLVDLHWEIYHTLND